ncbi:MAG: type II toxin-antitoxin system RelE/ParE family toxin [Arcobacteraceae bacterium]|jgi:plasmid stabilization system protein ParE|nr:type II toxin-antitoxin system RelE/ParE family toxin [Arcobacteraceae bacterium]
MKIIKDSQYTKALCNIIRYIAQDKLTAAKNFESNLNHKIKKIPHFPYKHRKSFYFQDDTYRDLIYKGYTVIYKIQTDTIIILDIFKWTDVK